MKDTFSARLGQELLVKCHNRDVQILDNQRTFQINISLPLPSLLYSLTTFIFIVTNELYSDGTQSVHWDTEKIKTF